MELGTDDTHMIKRPGGLVRAVPVKEGGGLCTLASQRLVNVLSLLSVKTIKEH